MGMGTMVGGLHIWLFLIPSSLREYATLHQSRAGPSSFCLIWARFNILLYFIIFHVTFHTIGKNVFKLPKLETL